MPSRAESAGDDKLAKEHPIVDKLIKMDVQYRSLEDEYQKKWAALAKEYQEKQDPILKEREQMIKTEKKLDGFWLQVLMSHPVFADQIQEWDRPVLKHLSDIKIEQLDCPQQMNRAGFKVIFEFSENDYLLNEKLVRVYNTKLESDYHKVQCEKISMEEELNWKIGMDVTVAPGNKPNKKKGNKKNKPKMEARDSFFSYFFRTINNDDPEQIQDLLNKTLRDLEADMSDCEEEELEQMYEDALEKVNDDAYEMAMALRDQLVPFAIRWYTGEAMPEIEEDEEEDEDEEDKEDDEDEESDEDEMTAEGEDAGNKKNIFGSKPAEELKEGEAGKDPNTEECKQQ